MYTIGPPVFFAIILLAIIVYIFAPIDEMRMRARESIRGVQENQGNFSDFTSDVSSLLTDEEGDTEDEQAEEMTDEEGDADAEEKETDEESDAADAQAKEDSDAVDEQTKRNDETSALETEQSETGPNDATNNDGESAAVEE